MAGNCGYRASRSWRVGAGMHGAREWVPKFQLRGRGAQGGEEASREREKTPKYLRREAGMKGAWHLWEAEKAPKCLTLGSVSEQSASWPFTIHCESTQCTFHNGTTSHRGWLEWVSVSYTSNTPLLWLNRSRLYMPVYTAAQDLAFEVPSLILLTTAYGVDFWRWCDYLLRTGWP